MSRTLREEILKGFDGEFDCLGFRPQLQMFIDCVAEVALPEPLDKLGPSTLARIGMAAVEQNSKLLGNGNLEKLRFAALRTFGECLIESARWDGEADAMASLAGNHPDLVICINTHHFQRSVRRFNFRRRVAQLVLELLNDIAARRDRARSPGRPSATSVFSKSPEQMLDTLVDAEILNQATLRLPVIQRYDREEIRGQLRAVIRIYLVNGHLDPRGETQQEAIDSHYKRLSRHLDKLAS